MHSFSFPAAVALLGCLVLGAGAPALAQAPVITSVAPQANTVAAPRSGPVTVSFSHPLTAASAGALQVHSLQRGGRRSRGATPATVNGNALVFAPAPFPFAPGETVHYTVTRAAASTGGPLARPRVGHFTTAVGGTGAGYFVPGTAVPVAGPAKKLAVGDVDGDGDLDVVAPNNAGSSASGTVSVRLNDGTGAFTAGASPRVNPYPDAVALGDVDGDGDLDLLTTSRPSGGLTGSLAIRLNDGSGTFSGTQDVAVGSMPEDVALGDLDGDGDLDVVVGDYAYAVYVCLNTGAGTFGAGQPVGAGTGPASVALGDVDGDGDVDCVAGDLQDARVSVLLNTGSAQFSNGPDVPVGSACNSMALGDLDGDGDLDLVAGYSVNAGVSVRLNTGRGGFTGTLNVRGIGYQGVALGDVDGDGDLDVASTSANVASVALNDGRGAFGTTRRVSLGSNPNTNSVDVCLGDADGDGDLDLFTAHQSTSSVVTVRLNQAQPLAAQAAQAGAGWALFPVPAHGTVQAVGLPPDAPLEVQDAVGRSWVVSQTDADGTVRLTLPPGLPAGMYVFRSDGQTRRFTVE